MGSSSNQQFNQLPRLTTEQQNLLLAALTSNKRVNQNGVQQTAGQNLNGGAHSQTQQQQNSPLQGGGAIDPSVLDSFDSDNLAGLGRSSRPTFGQGFFPNFGQPEADFDIDRPDFGEDLLNDYPDILGDAGGDDGEYGEKRKSPEDDEDQEDGDPKRRESEERVSKKPGRKPIMSEPTTKRKAQNRAAQRAFRERKEKHLKDLEDKVESYQKAAESATHENGLLKAQVDRLQSELREYRRRLSVAGNTYNQQISRSTSSGYLNRTPSSGNNSSLTFDFPGLSSLPDSNTNGNTTVNGSHRGSADTVTQRSNSTNSAVSPGYFKSGSMSPANQPSNQSRHSSLPNAANGSQVNGNGSYNAANPFSPDFGLGWPTTTTPPAMSDFNNSSMSNQQNNLSSLFNGIINQPSSTASNTASPSASSASNHNGPSSSCGTSPEPTHQSPAVKNMDPFTTNTADPFAAFSNELSPYANQTATNDFLNFDFIANQNGGQFDPVLFGEYRESQDAVVGLGEFSGGLYDDLPLPEFDPNKSNTLDGFSFNLATDKTIPAPVPNKPSLMEQVAAQQNGEYIDPEVKTDPLDEKAYFTCHAVWNRLQNCPKFASGDFDIDGLCKELSTKAKCSETGKGVSFPKEDVEAALWRLAGKKEAEELLAKQDSSESGMSASTALAREKERLRQQKLEALRMQHEASLRAQQGATLHASTG